MVVRNKSVLSDQTRCLLTRFVQSQLSLPHTLVRRPPSVYESSTQSRVQAKSPFQIWKARHDPENAGAGFTVITPTCSLLPSSTR